MKIGEVCVVFVVCFTLICTCAGQQQRARARETRLRRKRVGKKGTLFRPIAGRVADPVDDLTDIQKWLNAAGSLRDPGTGSTGTGTGCSGGADLQNLLSSVFIPTADVDDMALDMARELEPDTGSKKGKKKSRYIMKNRTSKTLGSISTYAAPRGDSGSCCETKMDVTAPGVVMMENKEYGVVHMNHSYQYVQVGECTNPGSECSGTGICTQRYKFAFLLVYDSELEGRVNPPVRYGRVPVRSHCECMNIGAVG